MVLTIKILMSFITCDIIEMHNFNLVYGFGYDIHAVTWVRYESPKNAFEMLIEL